MVSCARRPHQGVGTGPRPAGPYTPLIPFLPVHQCRRPAQSLLPRELPSVTLLEGHLQGIERQIGAQVGAICQPQMKRERRR